MRVFYLVHDLEDAAVARRVRFLRQGGAEVLLTGFRRQRDGRPGAPVEGLEIGLTRNGRMLQRVIAAARAIVVSGRLQNDLDHSDLIVVRNLEMLAIAVAVRGRFGSSIPIVYECLDIHRLMTRAGPIGASLRRVERELLSWTALMLTSSPQFITAYFERFHRRLPPWALLENKPLEVEMLPLAAEPGAARTGPPWRIGWFGIIRCRRSLELLASLVRASAGMIEVDIRGRPARDAIPDFDAVVARTPGLWFGGPYDRTTDLALLYGRVHFNWAVDFYEEGENSAWLLPNRLYEGSVFGTVPIALHHVETGRWLQRHSCGVLLTAPLEDALRTFFETLTQDAFGQARARVLRLDRAALVETEQTANAFVARLRDVVSNPIPRGRLI